MIIKDKKYIFSNYITERRRRSEEDDDNGRGVPPGFEPDPVDPVDPPEGGGQGDQGGGQGGQGDGGGTDTSGVSQGFLTPEQIRDAIRDGVSGAFDVTGIQDRLDRLTGIMGDTAEQDFSIDLFRKFTTPEGREELLKPIQGMIDNAREGKGISLLGAAGTPAFKPKEELARIERGFGKVRKTLASRRAKGLDRKRDIGQPEPLMPETPGFRGSRGPQRGFGGGATGMNEQFVTPRSAATGVARAINTEIDPRTGRARFNPRRNLNAFEVMSQGVDNAPIRPTQLQIDAEARAARNRIAQPGYQSQLTGADRDRIIGRVAAERGIDPSRLRTNVGMRERGVQGSGPGGSYTSTDRLNDLAGRVAAERGSVYNPDGSINFNSPEITGARETGNRMRGPSPSGYPSRFPGSMVGPAGRPASQERLDAMDARIAEADRLRERIASGEISPQDVMDQIVADGPSAEEREARSRAADERRQSRADYEVSDAGREAVQDAIAAENASRARRGLPPMNPRTERSFSRKVISTNVSRGVAAASARKAEEERLSTAAQQGEDEYLDSVFPGGRDLPYAERQPEPSGSYDPNRPGGSVGGFDDTTRPPNTSSEDESPGNRRPMRPAPEQPNTSYGSQDQRPENQTGEQRQLPSNDDPPAMRPARDVLAMIRDRQRPATSGVSRLGLAPPTVGSARLGLDQPSGRRTMEYRRPMGPSPVQGGQPQRPNLATQFRSRRTRLT